MTAEILLFLPSIAPLSALVYLEQLIESGTLLPRSPPQHCTPRPNNMVTEEVKRSLLNHARVSDAVILVEPNKPRRALLNIAPREDSCRGSNLNEPRRRIGPDLGCAGRQ